MQSEVIYLIRVLFYHCLIRMAFLKYKGIIEIKPYLNLSVLYTPCKVMMWSGYVWNLSIINVTPCQLLMIEPIPYHTLFCFDFNLMYNRSPYHSSLLHLPLNHARICSLYKTKFFINKGMIIEDRRYRSMQWIQYCEFSKKYPEFIFLDWNSS